MSEPVRTFTDTDGVRGHVPLLGGLFGPSSGGKTFSALRLATGIQRVSGGDIYMVDTEAKRGLHYADRFKFRHVSFDPPFGSLDYLAAIKHCVSKGAGVTIIDSMSHEHIGRGGYLETHENELDRIAGNDWSKREKVNFLAWAKPAQARQRMITEILQLNTNLIFCFRAKEKIKLSPGKPVTEMGFMPLAGEELLFEMTVNALLLPKADGVPTWRSDQIGERLCMKLPEQFKAIFAESKSLDEDIGQKLAEWAKGGQAPAFVRDDKVSDTDAFEAAQRGAVAFREYWSGLTKRDRAALMPQMDKFKRIAADADARNSAVGLPRLATATGEDQAPLGSSAEGAAGLRDTAAPTSSDILLIKGESVAKNGIGALDQWLDEWLDDDDRKLVTDAMVARWRAIATTVKRNV